MWPNRPAARWRLVSLGAGNFRRAAGLRTSGRNACAGCHDGSRARGQRHSGADANAAPGADPRRGSGVDRCTRLIHSGFDADAPSSFGCDASFDPRSRTGSGIDSPCCANPVRDAGSCRSARSNPGCSSCSRGNVRSKSGTTSGFGSCGNAGSNTRSGCGSSSCRHARTESGTTSGSRSCGNARSKSGATSGSSSCRNARSGSGAASGFCSVCHACSLFGSDRTAEADAA